MPFDSKALKELLAKSDGELWAFILQIARASGISMSDTPPPKAEMTKLRAVLGGAEGMDMQSALGILNKYRKQG